MNVYQTSPGVSYKIKKWGCAFLSLMYWVEKLKNLHLTTHAVNTYADELERVGAVDAELTVFWDKVLKYFGLPYKRFNEKPEYKLKDDEFEVQHWYNPNTGITHFVVGEGGMTPTWDPYPNSKTVREGFIVSRRVFRKVESDE